MQSSSRSRICRIRALAKKIKPKRFAPDQVRNSEISKRHLLEEENAALVTYDTVNYVISTDNDNNNNGTSLLRVDFSPELKDDLQISDFVNDNDDDSIKDSNYESDFTASIQIPDVEVVDTQAANLQTSGPEEPDTQLADTKAANTQPADTKIASPKKKEGKSE
ncbi:unnamed protein product [Diabrotica balteata]|uniref:Uncharacterized protein n=1 Tax=Diabrotica balteata TaxID=107213 RepID=A0A9N9T6D3_DIABA|nr:unnamed protein product [Diabrotica balteata]